MSGRLLRRSWRMLNLLQHALGGKNPACPHCLVFTFMGCVWRIDEGTRRFRLDKPITHCFLCVLLSSSVINWPPSGPHHRLFFYFVPFSSFDFHECATMVANSRGQRGLCILEILRGCSLIFNILMNHRSAWGVLMLLDALGNCMSCSYPSNQSTAAWPLFMHRAAYVLVTFCF